MSRRQVLALAGTLVLAGALATGCGDDVPDEGESCRGIAVDDVGRALGVDSLELEDVPGDTGCMFVDPERRERPQVLVQETEGGPEDLAERRQLTSGLYVEPVEDLDRDDGAWLVIGLPRSGGGGTQLVGQAALLDGGLVVQVVLAQAEGLSREAVRERVVAVLDLVSAR